MIKNAEFIQMLGNPNYVLALVDRGFFSQEEFQNYLERLKHFLKKPELLKLIKYPEGLFNLKTMM